MGKMNEEVFDIGNRLEGVGFEFENLEHALYIFAYGLANDETGFYPDTMRDAVIGFTEWLGDIRAKLSDVVNDIFKKVVSSDL